MMTGVFSRLVCSLLFMGATVDVEGRRVSNGKDDTTLVTNVLKLQDGVLCEE